MVGRRRVAHGGDVGAAAAARRSARRIARGPAIARGEHEREDEAAGGQHGRRPLYNRGDGALRSPRRAGVFRYPESRRVKSARGATLARELRALGAAHRRGGRRSGITPTSTRASAKTRPALLLNAHVDTVPANSRLHVAAAPARAARRSRCTASARPTPRAAIAAILEALARRPGAPAGGRPVLGRRGARRQTCMRRLPGQPGAPAGWSRRSSASRPAAGWASAIAASAPRRRPLDGPGGHSSRVDGLGNPIAVLARAAVALDEMGPPHREQGPAGFRGICLNVAAPRRRHRLQRHADPGDAVVVAAAGAGRQRRRPAGRGRAAGARRGVRPVT